MPLVLNGTLSLETVLTGDLSLETVLNGDLSLENTFVAEFGEYIGVSAQQYEIYDGEYVVIPKVSEQILETRDKVMKDEVTIKEVPVYKTSNPSGGNTVYIASELVGG